MIDINCDMAIAGKPLSVSAHVVHYDSMHPKTFGRRRAQMLLEPESVNSLRLRSAGGRTKVLQPLPREMSAGQLLREISGDSSVGSFRQQQ